MASGKTHDFLAIASTLSAGCYIYAHHLTNDFTCLLLFLISSLFGGLMFGPDLDIRSVQYKRWGILKFIWLPYQSFGHRSKKTQSHDALFGPVVRIVYFYLAIVALSIFCAGVFSIFNLKLSLGFLISIVNLILEIPSKYQVSFLIGLWYGNIIHYFADWLWEFIPRARKKSW